MRRIAWAVALALTLGLASCGGSDDKPKPPAPAPLIVGTMNFPESEILGELYTQALARRACAPCSSRPSGRGRSPTAPCAAATWTCTRSTSGSCCRRSTTSWSARRARRRRTSSPATSNASDGFTLLEQTSFSNENALAVEKAFGREHKVARSPTSSACARRSSSPHPSSRGRFEGLVGLRRTYGLRSLKLMPWEAAGEQYPALDDGKTDVAVVYTTDSQLASGRYTVLRDPEGLFAEQHVAPVISQKALERLGPKLPARSTPSARC